MVFRQLPWVIQHSYWKLPSIVSSFPKKWWCSIVMLVYQRVPWVNSHRCGKPVVAAQNIPLSLMLCWQMSPKWIICFDKYHPYHDALPTFDLDRLRPCILWLHTLLREKWCRLFESSCIYTRNMHKPYINDPTPRSTRSSCPPVHISYTKANHRENSQVSCWTCYS